jgi:hypothetical protein
MSEIAKADERAAQNQESLVDVRPPFVAYAKPPATGKPRQCPLYYPPVASQLLATLDAPSGYPRLNAPLSQEPSAARVIVAFVGVELFGPSARPTAFTLHRRDRVEEVIELVGVVHVGACERYGKRHASGVGDDVSVTTCRFDSGLLRSMGLGPVLVPPFSRGR